MFRDFLTLTRVKGMDMITCMLMRGVGTFILVAVLVGCGALSAPTPSVFIPGDQKGEKRAPDDVSAGSKKIAIFFDGTSNEERSATNVWTFYKSVVATGRVTAFYIEGVGAHGKAIGMATAWGLGLRVREAYSFLLQQYRAGDEIYLFGFSRGAYAARVLASMLYHAGLPSNAVPKSSRPSPDALSALIFDAFKCSTWATYSRCAAVTSVQRAADINRAIQDEAWLKMTPVSIRFMGLWDTVEALGWPDYEENVDVPNPRYGDQLCNVKKAAQAIALDDNRSRIFTPILLTRRHLLADCTLEPNIVIVGDSWKVDINERVEEVYFAGAHADVGGGYTGEPQGLSLVSLNWMWDQAFKEGLPIERIAVEGAMEESQRHMACTHDPEGAGVFNVLYKRQYRAIDRYADSADSSSEKIKFHACLIEHIEARPRGFAEYAGSDPLAQELLDKAGPSARFRTCFEKTGGVFSWKPTAECKIEIVGECVAANASAPQCGS